MSTECHPSVDYLWLQLIDRFLSTFTDVYESSLQTLFKFLMGKLKATQSSLRTKAFCAILESLATVFKTLFKNELEFPNDDFHYFAVVIGDNCLYGKDVEIRISCAKSMNRIVTNLAKRESGNPEILKILMIQLNDESVDIRNEAVLSMGTFLHDRQFDNTLASFVQRELVKNALQRPSAFVEHLTENAPLGFNEETFAEKNSVFDSEEINFHYDFVEVHSCLGLNFTEARNFICEHPVEAILNESAAFARAYQMRLLGK